MRPQAIKEICRDPDWFEEKGGTKGRTDGRKDGRTVGYVDIHIKLKLMRCRIHICYLFLRGNSLVCKRLEIANNSYQMNPRPKDPFVNSEEWDATNAYGKYC